MDIDTLWQKFLERIKEQVVEFSYDTWFKESKLYDLSNNTATVIVPMKLHIKHLDENYKDLITKVFNELTGTNFKFVFKLKEDVGKKPKTDTIIENIQEGVPYQSVEDANLNPNNTFENFIVGNSNKFAFVAAQAVAEKPGKAYNPLFLYSKSGLGKTHLMQAIGNYILKNSNMKVLYISSDKFVNDFINAVRTNDKNNFNKIDNFKNRYRNIDVLIIDDIQFLAGATESQKEFFHTFNNLYGENKQIIISSDRSPNDLKVFEDRLRTRFSWGLPVNIYPPDFELKVAILKKRIVGEQVTKEIPEQVIEYMASNIGTDIRQLEGSVNRLMAYSTMMGAEIDLNLAIEALKDYVNKGFSEKNDVSRIQKIVADYFKISIEDLKSKKRNADIAFPRQIAMYLCRKLTDESFPKIGIEFGGKDHSTVMHSCEKIEQEIKTNKNFAETIDKLEKDIHN